MYGDSSHRSARRTVPRDRRIPVPEYDSAELAALDEALVTAMEQAHAAEEAMLAPLLRCEVGTLRYKDTLGV